MGQALPPPSTQVGPVVLSWLAPVLPRIRYKILPARLLGGESGTKFSLLGVLLSKAVQNSPCVLKVRRIGPFQASWESFVPEVGPCNLCWESFVPKWRGVVLVGRIMSCSGVVLVPVGGLWQRPGAAHGHCGWALRTLRRPPHQWGLVADGSCTGGPTSARAKKFALRRC